MRTNPLWIKVVDCFTNTSGINVFDLAIKASDGQQAQTLELAQRFNNNLNALKIVENIDLTVQTVPMHATLEDSIDMFDRVNSQGTKLTDAELALTHITGKWSQARRVMKEKITSLEKKNFYLDLAFLTRSLTGIAVKHALFDLVHRVPREDLEIGWAKFTKIADYLVRCPAPARLHPFQPGLEHHQ